MGFTKDEAQFWAAANKIAEAEFAATFDEDRKNENLRALFTEYVRDGRPERESWLRNRLASIFLCNGANPAWVESSPMWPFWKKRAMVFIGQIPVDSDEVAHKHLSNDAVLYVFGLRVESEDGSWEMQYRVVEQLRHLR
jgi:hypothetical protein